MSDYTPTTEEVIDTYYDAPGMQSPRFDGHEFDRWLAAHDAAIRADEREKACHAAWEAVDEMLFRDGEVSRQALRSAVLNARGEDTSHE